LLYATGQNAVTVVFRPNPDKLDVVAVNRLPGSCNATPAVADGRIFFRTDGFLYCIGE
jgi:outer membrane protein assembly factor BamB